MLTQTHNWVPSNPLNIIPYFSTIHFSIIQQFEVMHVSLTFKNSYVLYGRNNLKERHDVRRNNTMAIHLSLSKIQYGCQHLKKYKRRSTNGHHFIILRDVRILTQGIVSYKVVYSKSPHIFRTFRSHLDILGAIKVM